VTPVLTQDGRALQMTPVNSKDGEALPELDINYRTVGSRPGPAVFLEMVRTDARALQSGRDGWEHCPSPSILEPSLLHLPTS